MKSELEYKKEELIKDLRRLFKSRNNKRPRTIDVQNDKGGPKYKTYLKYFGSWNNALKEAEVNNDES